MIKVQAGVSVNVTLAGTVVEEISAQLAALEAELKAVAAKYGEVWTETGWEEE